MNWRLILLMAAGAVIALTSCSEQKRCARYVKKHPECFKTDTVWKETIVESEIKHDTTFIGRPAVKTGTDTCACISDSNSKDTFNNKLPNGLNVKTVADWKKRTLDQSVEKPAVPHKCPVIYKSYPVTTNKLSFWQKAAYGLMGLLILLLAIGRVKSK